jgi:hypothetical protein
VRTNALIALALLLLGLQACDLGDSNPRAAEAISADEFVHAYVALRRVGLRSAHGEILPEARDSVLDGLGLTEENLLTFVDVWGEDRLVMESVWAAVDSLMREERMRPRGGEVGEEDPDPEPRGPPGRRGEGGS